MLQVQVSGRNVANRAITPTLYIIVVSEGSFTVEGLGKCSTNIGVISSQDILDAKSLPYVNYADVESVNGGNFFSGLKNFGSDVLKYLKDEKAISKGLKTIGTVPNPYAQAASQAAPFVEALGYGNVPSGGKGLKRKQMKNKYGY